MAFYGQNDWMAGQLSGRVPSQTPCCVRFKPLPWHPIWKDKRTERQLKELHTIFVMLFLKQINNASY